MTLNIPRPKRSWTAGALTASDAQHIPRSETESHPRKVPNPHPDFADEVTSRQTDRVKRAGCPAARADIGSAGD
ncbi:MAG: hypothetical protein IPH48_15600 [bacterium]|nr:hypothetical protein [bacterium]